MRGVINTGFLSLVLRVMHLGDVTEDVAPLHGTEKGLLMSYTNIELKRDGNPKCGYHGTSSTTLESLKIWAALYRLFVGIGSPAGV